VAFGLRLDASHVTPALTRAARSCGLPAGTAIDVRAAGRAGTWVLGTEPEPLGALASALAAELRRPVRFYGVSVQDGRLRAEGHTLHPAGARAPIAAAREDAPADDPAEAQAWLAIRLEVQEGLDDHDASVRSLVWPWSAE
jgi:hypothetical protein